MQPQRVLQGPIAGLEVAVLHLTELDVAEMEMLYNRADSRTLLPSSNIAGSRAGMMGN